LLLDRNLKISIKPMLVFYGVVWILNGTTFLAGAIIFVTEGMDRFQFQLFFYCHLVLTLVFSSPFWFFFPLRIIKEMRKQLENEVTRSRRSHHEEVIKKIKNGVAVQTVIGVVVLAAAILALMPVLRDHTANLFHIITFGGASTTGLQFFVFGGLKRNQYAHQSYYKEPPAKSTDSGKVTQPQNLQTGGVDSVDNFDVNPSVSTDDNNNNNNKSSGNNSNNNNSVEHNIEQKKTETHMKDDDNNKATDVPLVVAVDTEPTTEIQLSSNDNHVQEVIVGNTKP
jgi:hypothetical protein